MKLYRWTKIWGIDAPSGQISEGDQVLMQDSNGLLTEHVVGVTMEYTTRGGKLRTKAFVITERNEND